jgi:hypothetical protein
MDPKVTRAVKKPAIFSLMIALTSCAAHSGEADPAPSYVSEAPLPEGWPAPGPYNEVSEKTFPAYRAAFTSQSGETMAFWRLFLHIKSRDIPMTAPVEMGVEPEANGMRRSTMAFLYQNGEVGEAGADGERIEVRDVPEAKALNYAWQGPDSRANVATAREALDKALAEKGLTASSFRLLGYNGPGTPRAKATWELQALLE